VPREQTIIWEDRTTRALLELSPTWKKWLREEDERMANKKAADEDQMTSMVEVLMSVITGLAGTIERQTETIDKLLRVVEDTTEPNEAEDEPAKE
jgi:hypothetical protein